MRAELESSSDLLRATTVTWKLLLQVTPPGSTLPIASATITPKEAMRMEALLTDQERMAKTDMAKTVKAETATAETVVSKVETLVPVKTFLMRGRDFREKNNLRACRSWLKISISTPWMNLLPLLTKTRTKLEATRQARIFILIVRF